MVDVSDKPVTTRRAVAEATVKMDQETLTLVIDGSGPKGDVMSVAELAGIMAAKRTAELIPLCHPLTLSDVTVEITPDRKTGVLIISASAATTAPDRGRDGGDDGGLRGRTDRLRHGQGRRPLRDHHERPTDGEEWWLERPLEAARAEGAGRSRGGVGHATWRSLPSPAAGLNGPRCA